MNKVFSMLKGDSYCGGTSGKRKERKWGLQFFKRGVGVILCRPCGKDDIQATP